MRHVVGCTSVLATVSYRYVLRYHFKGKKIKYAIEMQHVEAKDRGHEMRWEIAMKDSRNVLNKDN